MNLSQDFCYGFRVLWKNRVYAFVSLITLAIGIGASTAIFSVVNGVLLRPLPYPKPEQIVRVWETNAKGRTMQFADPNFEDVRAQVHSLQGMAAMRSGESTVSVGNAPDRVRVASVSADFFSVIGVQPLLGRLFVPEEQRFGAAPAVLVSHSFWQRQLHETRDLASVKFTVSNNPAVIVGVLLRLWLPIRVSMDPWSYTRVLVVAKLVYAGPLLAIVFAYDWLTR